MVRSGIYLAILALSLPVAAQQTASDFNALGVEYYNAKQWADAVDAFEQARALSTGNATVQRNLANAYQALANEQALAQDYRSAIDCLNRAISVDPENPMLLVQLGFYYLREGRVTEAVYRLEEATQLAPENVDARVLLGDAYYDDNDTPSALAEWEWAAQAEPNRPGLKEKIAKALRENKVEQNFGEHASRHFNISFGRDTAGRDLREVLRILEKAYRDVGQRLGRTYPPTPIQVIIYTGQGFSEATQLSEHIGALYDGKIRVPLTDETGAPVVGPELERRLYHEYVHVVVRNLTGDRVPWWLNEGLAETFSKNLGERETAVLQQHQQAGTLLSLASLEASQLDKRSPAELRLAYYQANAAVQYLWTRFGARKMLDMLNSLRAGESAESAIRLHYHRTYPMLEREIDGAIAKGNVG